MGASKTRVLFLVSAASVLAACGGGGGGSSDSQAPRESEPELVFEYAPAPLHPKAFNMAASTGEPEHHFAPGETLSLITNVDIYYSDNSAIAPGEQFLYDTSIYLSTDDQIQETDLRLFTIECSMPGTSVHACGETSHFRCVYAHDNANTMRCTSIPLSRTYGFTDLSVDTSAWLDTVPKAANVIFHACLRDQPDLCTDVAYPIQLN